VEADRLTAPILKWSVETQPPSTVSLEVASGLSIEINGCRPRIRAGQSVPGQKVQQLNQLGHTNPARLRDGNLAHEESVGDDAIGPVHKPMKSPPDR